VETVIVRAGGVTKSDCCAFAELAAAAAANRHAKATAFIANTSRSRAFLQTARNQPKRGLQCGREVAENESREAEEQKKPDHVGDGRKQNCRGESRVDPKRF
jgi:hypothetical protein